MEEIEDLWNIDLNKYRPLIEWDVFLKCDRVTLIFEDFFHPKKKIRSRSAEDKTAYYLVWNAQSNTCYKRIGIFDDIPFCLNIADTSFMKAYKLFLASNRDKYIEIKELGNKKLDVEITFKRENNKTMKIFKINILYEKDGGFK
jgi:hypothetical protein